MYMYFFFTRSSLVSFSARVNANSRELSGERNSSLFDKSGNSNQAGPGGDLTWNLVIFLFKIFSLILQ